MGKAKAKAKGGGLIQLGALGKTDSDNLKGGGRVDVRFSSCRACRVKATSCSLSLHADINTSALWDTRSHHLLLFFASVSHSPSVISRAFRSSVKQLHHDFPADACYYN